MIGDRLSVIGDPAMYGIITIPYLGASICWFPLRVPGTLLAFMLITSGTLVIAGSPRVPDSKKN